MSDAGWPPSGGAGPDGAVDDPHRDVAGWVMGALDPGEAERFATHLETCAACRQEVLELQPVLGWLDVAAPQVELPPGLQARTLVAVERAAAADRRRSWRTRALAAAAAVVLVGGAGATWALTHRDAGPTVTIAMSAPGSGTAHGVAVGHDTPAGWSVTLSVSGLPQLPDGQHYECWYAAPDNTPEHPDVVSAGSFEVGPDGAATDVHMWTVVDLKNQKGTTMLVTREPDTNPALTGAIVLSGAVPA